jgi:hypothetical protein
MQKLQFFSFPIAFPLARFPVIRESSSSNGLQDHERYSALVFGVAILGDQDTSQRHYLHSCSA